MMSSSAPCAGGYSLADPEALVAEMADNLRESALDEAIWGGWPICIAHTTHPLEPMLLDGLACWVSLRRLDR